MLMFAENELSPHLLTHSFTNLVVNIGKEFTRTMNTPLGKAEMSTVVEVLALVASSSVS